MKDMRTHTSAAREAKRATPARPAVPMRRISSPLGELVLVANEGGNALEGIYFARQKHFPGDTVTWRDARESTLLDQAEAQLHEYFAGRRTTFDLPLAPVGTAFQRRVWQAIAGVPFGTTISYAELARRLGTPSAVRAAAAATGRNPLTVVIPCHRIVGSDGRLMGYAGGVERKRALLDLEGPSAHAARREVA